MERIVFELNSEQYQRYLQWQRGIEERVARQQVATGRGFNGTELRGLILKAIEKSLENGEPKAYYGASVGAYAFHFVPMGVDVSITVENVVTGDKLHLTESDTLAKVS